MVGTGASSYAWNMGLDILFKLGPLKTRKKAVLFIDPKRKLCIDRLDEDVTDMIENRSLLESFYVQAEFHKVYLLSKV